MVDWVVVYRGLWMGDVSVDARAAEDVDDDVVMFVLRKTRAGGN